MNELQPATDQAVRAWQRRQGQAWPSGIVRVA